MISTFISSKQIIAKLFSDLDIQDDSQRITDIREWIGEAIEKIGAVTQLDHKESGVNNEPILVVKNYQVQLPSDLYRLTQVAFATEPNGNWSPLSGNTNSFKNYNYDTDYTWKNRTDYTVSNTYFIKPGFIVLNRESGYLKLSYDAILIDSEGYPLIPELQSYQEAIYWYVVMKLKYPEYLNGKLRQDVYYDIRRSWNFYRQQAYAEALLPNTADEMETIKNVWNSMVPDYTAHDVFYSGINDRQKMYDNYYGRPY
jgi:hypothetical protein